MKRRTIESPPLSTERRDTSAHSSILSTRFSAFRPALLRSWWEAVQDSLWLIPALGTLFCGGLAFGLVWLESDDPPLPRTDADLFTPATSEALFRGLQ